MIPKVRQMRLAALVLFAAGTAGAYPLDGVDRTKIGRLTGYTNKQAADRGVKLPKGALLDTADVDLHLTGKGRDWDLNAVEKDSFLQTSVDSIFKTRHASYAIAVADFTDPNNIAWAGRQEDYQQYPGSVGKTVTMVGYFDALARAFPSTEKRAAVLRDHVVEATEWVQWDSHKVPHFDPATGKNKHGAIRPGQSFRMSEWIDHMVSPSANAAGATVWKEAMLLRHFGSAYPVTAEQERAFFKETSKTELTRLSLAVSEDALKAVGLDTASIRQGSFWTKHGKSVVPGVKSYGSPRELLRLLVRIEQGRLVDEWSSREMKRYLYMTKKRYRYAYPRELRDAAVYFKSGSLYSCQAEEGFRCGKYKGNVKNFMNSIAIIESPANPKEGETQYRYAVALMSNILRKNSAWDHARLAAAVEEAVRTRGQVSVVEKGSSGDINDAGASL